MESNTLETGKKELSRAKECFNSVLEIFMMESLKEVRRVEREKLYSNLEVSLKVSGTRIVPPKMEF